MVDKKIIIASLMFLVMFSIAGNVLAAPGSYSGNIDRDDDSGGPGGFPKTWTELMLVSIGALIVILALSLLTHKYGVIVMFAPIALLIIFSVLKSC